MDVDLVHGIPDHDFPSSRFGTPWLRHRNSHATRLHCVDGETLFDGPLTPTEEGAANGQTVLDLAG